MANTENIQAGNTADPSVQTDRIPTENTADPSAAETMHRPGNPKKSKDKKKISGKRILLAVIIIVLAAGLAALAISFYVDKQGGSYVALEIRQEKFTLDKSDISTLKAKNADCILVLGAGVRPDGTPTKMLADRLELGTALYKAGVAPKIMFSGDNGQVEYNEVKVMKAYAVDAGIPEKDIFLDHAGFSTYESMYRAKDVFEVKKAIVVTQGYHESRALYVGRALGLEVWGAASDQRTYSGQITRDLREVLARDKDFFKVMYKPEPKYLGKPIPISGDGRATE